MLDQNKVTQLKDLLPAASSTLVLLNNNPSLDQVAVALALAHSLSNAGKEVVLAAPNELSGVVAQLLGAKDVKDKLGSQVLTISFPYDEAAVDKVSYHISDDSSTFYLMIKPQKGHKPLPADGVTFDYTGAEADMIFLVGVHSYDQLEHLYAGFESIYEHATLVTLHTFEPEIGAIKLDLSGKSCMSESLFSVLGQLELTLDVDSATNLLSAIEQATANFTSFATTAETFETVAALLRLGARRVRLQNSAQSGLQSGVQTTVQSAVKSKQQSLIGGQIADGQINPFGAALQQSAAVAQPSAQIEISPPPKKQKKKKWTDASGEPGSLNYQPGSEGSTGRG